MDDIKKKRDLKNERKRIQEENVQRKQQEKDAKDSIKEEKKNKKTRFAEDDSQEETKLAASLKKSDKPF